TAAMTSSRSASPTSWKRSSLVPGEEVVIRGVRHAHQLPGFRRGAMRARRGPPRRVHSPYAGDIAEHALRPGRLRAEQQPRDRTGHGCVGACLYAGAGYAAAVLGLPLRTREMATDLLAVAVEEIRGRRHEGPF